MGLGHAREREKDEAGRDHAFPIHPRVRESGDRDAIALPPVVSVFTKCGRQTSQIAYVAPPSVQAGRRVSWQFCDDVAPSALSF